MAKTWSSRRHEVYPSHVVICSERMVGSRVCQDREMIGTAIGMEAQTADMNAFISCGLTSPANADRSAR
jgi:hypothetical protein